MKHAQQVVSCVLRRLFLQKQFKLQLFVAPQESLVVLFCASHTLSTYPSR